MELEEFKASNKNKDFSLISRDCLGGFLYHQLGLKFSSPTINLFFSPLDFNYFCLHLKRYLKTELIEYKDEEADYPVGILKPRFGKEIRIDFMHFDSFEIAKQKWEERKQRVNYKNIYVVSTFCYPKEIATFSKKLVKTWNKIKFKKVMIVDKEYGFKDEFIIKEPINHDGEYAWLLVPDNIDKEWKKVFNNFDFISFLNNK